jgi:Cu/Ag efflux pump CusA
MIDRVIRWSLRYRVIVIALALAFFGWGAYVLRDMPPEVEQPVLAPVSSIMGEIMFVALESDRHTPLEIRTAADIVLRRRLLAVPYRKSSPPAADKSSIRF